MLAKFQNGLIPIPHWAQHLHPKTIEFLRQPDGTIRQPSFEEWHEDFGLGYLDKCYQDKQSLHPQEVESVRGVMTTKDFVNKTNAVLGEVPEHYRSVLLKQAYDTGTKIANLKGWLNGKSDTRQEIVEALEDLVDNLKPALV